MFRRPACPHRLARSGRRPFKAKTRVRIPLGVPVRPMSDADTPPVPPRKPSLAVLFLIVVIDLVGFGIVLPLLPRYGEQYHVSPLLLGVLMASFSAMQFFFAP